MNKEYELLEKVLLTIDEFKERNPDLEYHIDKITYKLKKRGFSLDCINLHHGSLKGNNDMTISYWQEIQQEDEEQGEK